MRCRFRWLVDVGFVSSFRCLTCESGEREAWAAGSLRLDRILVSGLSGLGGWGSVGREK